MNILGLYVAKKYKNFLENNIFLFFSLTSVACGTASFECPRN